MFIAYLDDFNIIRVIISENKYDEFEKFSLKYDNKTYQLTKKSTIKKGLEREIVLESVRELLPSFDMTLNHNNMMVNVKLGSITKSPRFDRKYHFDDWLGYKYSNTKTTFRLWSPVVKECYLVLNNIKYKMNMFNNMLYETTVSGDLELFEYHYEIRIDDKFIRVNDPYANSSDANHKNNYILDFDKTYKMKNDYYNSESFNSEKAIIYELNVRDATSKINISNKGTFKALSKSANEEYGLGYIKKLGITHIQLLPIFDFGGVDELNKELRYNWGYNPIQYNVISGYFSENPNNPYQRINEFKELVDVIHGLNIGVNMDVVFNHVYNSAKFSFEKIVPGYSFRSRIDGTLTNSSWCGNDLKTDNYMIRKLIIDSVIFFQKFYKIDGFRFDLMGLIDINTINCVVNKVKGINNNAMIYGEGWEMDVELLNSARANMSNAKILPNVSFFNDIFRENTKDYIIGKRIDINKIFKNEKFINQIQSINYVECHDNKTFYDFLTSCIKNITKEMAIDLVRLSLGLVIISNGIPFIHAGEELLRTKKGIDNSYNQNDEINGINYSESGAKDTLIDLIKLRKKYDYFNNKEFKIKNNKDDIIEIRLITVSNVELQIIISNNYNSYEKFFVPGTKLVFNGENATNKMIQQFEINKPGVYIFEK